MYYLKLYNRMWQKILPLLSHKVQGHIIKRFVDTCFSIHKEQMCGVSFNCIKKYFISPVSTDDDVEGSDQIRVQWSTPPTQQSDTNTVTVYFISWSNYYIYTHSLFSEGKNHVHFAWLAGFIDLPINPASLCRFNHQNKDHSLCIDRVLEYLIYFLKEMIHIRPKYSNWHL